MASRVGVEEGGESRRRPFRRLRARLPSARLDAAEGVVPRRRRPPHLPRPRTLVVPAREVAPFDVAGRLVRVDGVPPAVPAIRGTVEGAALAPRPVAGRPPRPPTPTDVVLRPKGAPIAVDAHSVADKVGARTLGRGAVPVGPAQDLAPVGPASGKGRRGTGTDVAVVGRTGARPYPLTPLLLYFSSVLQGHVL